MIDETRAGLPEALRLARVPIDPAALDGLVGDYWRIDAMLGRNDGRVSGKWRVRIARLAELLLEERGRVEREHTAPVALIPRFRNPPKVHLA